MVCISLYSANRYELNATARLPFPLFCPIALTHMNEISWNQDLATAASLSIHANAHKSVTWGMFEPCSLVLMENCKLVALSLFARLCFYWLSLIDCGLRR